MTHEHVCLAYEDDAALRGPAREFLAAGAADGRELWWIGDRPPPGGFDVRVVPIGSAYPSGAVIDVEDQLRAYARATEAAVAAGRTGLRVVALPTALVRTPEQLEAFARYELLIDAYMATHPFSAMCAYDRRVLGDRAISQLACLHTLTNTDVPFRLHGCAPAEGAAMLAGELDFFTDELFETALGRLRLPDDDQVVLQATGLRFADHRTLLHLDHWAAERGRRVVLRGARGGIGRLAAMLDLEHLSVEAAA